MLSDNKEFVCTQYIIDLQAVGPLIYRDTVTVNSFKGLTWITGRAQESGGDHPMCVFIAFCKQSVKCDHQIFLHFTEIRDLYPASLYRYIFLCILMGKQVNDGPKLDEQPTYFSFS